MIASKVNWSVGVLYGFGLVCSACAGSAKSTTPTTKSDDATVCEPGTRRCDGDDIKRCNQTGTADSIELTCPKGQCRVQGNDAFCSTPVTPSVCTANQALCDGNIATKCKVDGSGTQPGGVDCAATKQHCLQGACSDALCVSDKKSCQNGDVYLCSSDGSSLSVWDFCTDSELCDEVSGTCLTRRCEPGKAICQGTRALTCNASGSDWLPDATDCAAQGEVCVAGSCEKKTCAASTTFCQDGNLYQCDPSGASSSLSKICRPGIEHCQVTPAGLYAFCVPYACMAGQKLCDGDVVKTCNADGSIPQDGTACGKDEVCEDAVCKPLGCHLNTFFCKGKDLYYCNRTESDLIQECDPGQACLAIIANPDDDASGNSGLANCAPLSCPPGKTGCVQNKVGTCGADGASLSAVTNDCGASGQICTGNGTCDTSAIDTVGLDDSAQPLSGGLYVGNVIDVHSPRKLTELQMWLAFPSARDLRWMVFELVGSEFISRAEKTTSISSSPGFVSSGPLSFSYQLEAGKRYALGVIMSGDGVSYYDMRAPLPPAENPSFGSVNGVAFANDVRNFNVTESFSAGMAAYMKVTTAPP